jgi:hypothetical protein
MKSILNRYCYHNLKYTFSVVTVAWVLFTQKYIKIIFFYLKKIIFNISMLKRFENIKKK